MTNTYRYDYFEYQLYPTFVVVTVFEGVYLDDIKVRFIWKKFREHFGKRHFAVISDRKYNYKVNLENYKVIPRNIKGIAVVSSDEQVKIGAINEQQLYEHSFAFFNNLDQAKSWADSLFVYSA